MQKGEDERESRCVVCGERAGAAGLCERCRESLHLCDAESYARRKIRAKNARTAAQTLPNADDL